MGRTSKDKLSGKTESKGNFPEKDHPNTAGIAVESLENDDSTPIESMQLKVECPLELCMNNSSHKYFIVLEEVNNNRARMIIPTGEIKVLELRLFSEPEIVEADKCRDLLTQEQQESYISHITEESNSYIDFLVANRATLQQRRNTIGRGEPSYITSYRNMLSNSNTFPSRMLRCIKEEGSISNQKLKNILSKEYGYLSNTSGSFSASLRVLYIDGFVDIKGTGNGKIISIRSRP